MLINSPNISGSLRVTGNAVITGSLTVLGGINATITGSVTSASYVEYSNVANKPTLVSGSSQVTYSGLTGIPAGIVSGSSQITYSGISSIPSGIVSGSSQVAALGFVTTGSNTFQANQTITGSLFITQNLVVAGSSSIQYISSSVVDIADNIITVNAFNPGVRFGGLAVADSGSSPKVSGSILFDSIKDQWIFVHENSTVVTSSVILMGPETYNDLGNESYISANRLPKGSGVEHLRDSNISDTGTVVSVNSNAAITGSFTVVSGSAVELQVTNLGVNIGSALTDSHIISGSVRINPNGLFVSGSGVVGIGTTSPQSIFHIGAPAPAFAGVKPYTGLSSTHEGFLFDYYYNTSASNLRVFDIAALGFAINGAGGSDIRFLTVPQTTTNTPIERLRITSGGNVGIGTTSPQNFSGPANQLVIGTTSGNNGITIAAATTGFSSIYFADGTTGNEAFRGYFEYGHASDYLGIGIAASERMRITSGGNVLIGTSSDDGNRLQVNGGVRTSGGITSAIQMFIEAGSLYISNGAGVTYSARLSVGYNYPYVDTFFDSMGGPSYEGRIQFRTSSNNGISNTRLTIMNSGNVGINNTSPTEGLVVATGALRVTSQALDFGAGTRGISIDTTGGNVGRIYTVTGTGTATDLTFGTNNSERMRITTVGNTLLIGSTTSAWANSTRSLLELNNSGSVLLGLRINGNERAYFYHNNTHLYIENMLNPGSIYVISISGGVYLTAGGTSWTSNSDERLKNINGNIENAVDKLMTLRTVNYSWKNDKNQKQNLGLIAQDVEKVFPQVIDLNKLPSKPNQEQEDKTEYLGVRYQELVPVLVKAIQEQQSQIEILKTKIEILEQS